MDHGRCMSLVARIRGGESNEKVAIARGTKILLCPAPSVLCIHRESVS